ncbi:uncharacterized protein cracdla [Brachyhypopomus gauderio]|uniref:uncharacterized protein cracdla n=1 Tax=Brachyhypopomus gauderio TaxID=698409 RepID=UPI004042F6FF
MEVCGDQEGGSSDDFTGRKRPKLQTLRSKLPGRMKRKGNEGAMKHAQSASDITQGILDLDVDFHSPQDMLGSRSWSHDSIFLADQTDPDPLRDFSHENIHGKIRTLQMKLQQQNLHLGPPPLARPIKRTEEPAREPVADGCLQSPPEILGLTKNPSCKPLAQSVSPRPPSPRRAPLPPSVPCPGVDFSTPPKFTPCLDSSAARHRMSVKPRNQRASTKGRRLLTSAGNRPHSESMNNVEQLLTEDKGETAVTKETTWDHSYSPQIILPGEGFTAPPVRNTCPASSRKPLTGSGDETFAHAKSQPEGTTSPSTPFLPQPITKQQTSVWEAAATQQPEFAESSSSVVESKQAPKQEEAVTGKLRGSSVASSVKGCEDHREVQFGYRLKSFQDSVSSTARLITMESEHSQLQSENPFYTIAKGKDVLQKDVIQKDGVQDLSHENHAGDQHQGFTVGLALRPSSQRGNTAPLDDKADGRNLQTVPPTGQVDKLPKESTNQPRTGSGSLRLAASPSERHERQRTASFTGVLEQTGSKREFPPPPIYTKTFKTKDHLTSQRPKGKEPCTNLSESLGNEKPDSIPVIPIKPRDLTLTLYAGRERGDGEAYDAQEKSVEVTESVEKMDGAKKHPKRNDVNEEGKEEKEKNAFGVKLRTTSPSLKCPTVKAQSEHTVKQQRTDVSTTTPAGVPECPAVRGHKDSSAGTVRGTLATTVFKRSLSPNTEALISPEALSPVPPSDNRDHDRTIRMSDLGASSCLTSSPTKEIKLVHSWATKENTPVPLTPKEGTSVPFTPKDGTPVPLTPKEGTPVPLTPKESTPVPITPKEGTPVPLTPKESTPVPITPKEGTPVPWFPKAGTQVSSSSKEGTSFCMLENTPLPTATKEPREPSSELSWISMAREKTRSLQQLFTSRLPDFPAFQSTMRPTGMASAPPQAQTSTSQSSGGSGRPTHQASLAPHFVRPSQDISAPPSAMQVPGKATHPSITLPSPMEHSIRPPQPTTDAVDLLLKQTVSTTGQTQLSIRPVQSGQPSSVSSTTYSTTKPVQSLPSPPQASSQLNLCLTQPTSLHLSPNPSLAPRQTSAARASSQTRCPVGGEGSSMLLEKADPALLSQEKGPVEGLVQRGGSVGSRTSFSKQTVGPTSELSKVEEQKVSQEYRFSPQPLTAIRTMASHSKLTESSPGPMRLDRGDKWQKTTVPPPSSSPPSSSSPPQSVRDSGQPSWMDLAKRKSLAWSDKTMD